MVLKSLYITLIIFVCCTYCSYGQNSNNFMEVWSNTSLNWSINTVSEVENNQTITGAITLWVKNRSNPSQRSVYVRVSNFTGPAGFTPPSIPLQLDYVSDNSSHETNLVTTPFTLTTTNQRLFTHKKHSSNSTYSFNYNIIHTATNWNFPPGTYNYTLTFTFVNP